jgi:uncharacterized protein YbjT (DUF2867 family)
MAAAILVMGATGTVGGAALDALHAAGTEPLALVRNAQRAVQVLDHRTPFRVADFANEGSVRAALQGVDAVLLCSAHGPAMRDQQMAAIRAIAATDVNRVVKISGSPVSVSSDSSSGTGRDHFAIEKALDAIGCVTVAIRPSPFMQNFLEQAPLIERGLLPGPDGEPRVSFVDARDIGRVAASALLSDEPCHRVLEVTGPEALTWFDVAAIMAKVLGRTITHQPMSAESIRQTLLGMGRPQWLVEHMIEIGALLRNPKAAEVTDTVKRTTERPAITLDEFLTDQVSAFRGAA